MKYKEELIEAMKELSKDDRVLIAGQSVLWKGTGLYWTIQDIPNEKKIEMPVLEDFQLGFCVGLSLEGYIPLCIFPRIDFMILAYNQLFNHLDLMKEMSDGQFTPKIIIRTAIGSVKPLFPGLQHTKDHTILLTDNLRNINVMSVLEPIFNYKLAMENKNSTILIENPDLYEEEMEEMK